MNGTGNGATAGRGLKALVVAGLLAMALLFGLVVTAAGATVVGVAGIAVGATAGGLAVAHEACGTVETSLARDLGIGVDELRGLTPATVNDRIAARVAGKALTAEQAQVSYERADAYATCQQVFGPRGTRDWHWHHGR